MLFRYHRLPGVNFQASELDGLLWVLLPVSHQVKLAVASVYVPPVSSPYFCNQFVAQLSSEIDQYSHSWLVVLAGDFNAHIGALPSIIHAPHPIFYERRRCSRFTRAFGKQIVDMCNRLNLLVLNGLLDIPSHNGWQPTRLAGDAAVDLVITSSSILPYIQLFEVSDEDVDTVTPTIYRWCSICSCR